MERNQLHIAFINETAAFQCWSARKFLCKTLFTLSKIKFIINQSIYLGGVGYESILPSSGG